RLAHIRRDVFAIMRTHGIVPSALESLVGEDFRIQAVRIGRRSGVGHVIHASRFENPDDAIHDSGIDQRAIAGDSNHDIATSGLRRAIIAVEDVVFAAYVYLVPELAYVVDHRLIAGIHRGGEHDLVDLL